MNYSTITQQSLANTKAYHSNNTYYTDAPKSLFSTLRNSQDNTLHASSPSMFEQSLLYSTENTELYSPQIYETSYTPSVSINNPLDTHYYQTKNSIHEKKPTSYSPHASSVTSNQYTRQNSSQEVATISTSKNTYNPQDDIRVSHSKPSPDELNKNIEEQEQENAIQLHRGDDQAERGDAQHNRLDRVSSDDAHDIRDKDKALQYPAQDHNLKDKKDALQSLDIEKTLADTDKNLKTEKAKIEKNKLKKSRSSNEISSSHIFSKKSTSKEENALESMDSLRFSSHEEGREEGGEEGREGGGEERLGGEHEKIHEHHSMVTISTGTENKGERSLHTGLAGDKHTTFSLTTTAPKEREESLHAYHTEEEANKHDTGQSKKEQADNKGAKDLHFAQLHSSVHRNDVFQTSAQQDELREEFAREERELSHMLRASDANRKHTFSASQLDKLQIPSFSQATNQNILSQVKLLLRKDKSGEIHLQLQPRELGEVKLKVSLSKKTVSIFAQVENEMARELIQKNIDNLIQEFNAEGYDVGEFSVLLSENSTESKREDEHNFNIHTQSTHDDGYQSERDTRTYTIGLSTTIDFRA